MELIIIDIVTSILQSLSMAYAISYCVDEDEKVDKLKIFIMTLLFIAGSEFYIGIFGEDWILSVFTSHILSLFITVIIYRKNFSSAVAAHTIVYLIICVCPIISWSLIYEYAGRIFTAEYINYEKILIMYIPEWFVLLFSFKCLSKIKQIYNVIIYKKLTITFFIISLIIDLILTFYLIISNGESQFIENIICVMFFLLFVAILNYFWKVKQKSQQIFRLNESLDLRNNELRKIKHDYGAQISYLYGLCLMDRFDDLKRALKDIISNNEATPTAATVTKDEKSLLSVALKPALEQGIHVIIEDNCDFKLVDIDELELYRVVSNIVSNAIKALNGQGIIIAKSYEYLGNAIIKIENNGPKIPKEHLDKIFIDGFTAKKNNDKNHGYGLSIANDLVKKIDGKIYVESNDEITKFKIVLPIRMT